MDHNFDIKNKRKKLYPEPVPYASNIAHTIMPQLTATRIETEKYDN